MPRSLGVWLAIMAGGLALIGQQPPAAEEPKPEKPGVVQGAVFDANTGAPLSKATVIMMGTATRTRSRISTRTGADGTFSFDEVSPGQWHLSASRNRYARQSYGQKGTSSRGTALRVAAGQEITDITFKLVPAAVVTGRVVDEDGEPIPHCRVMAMKFVYTNGRRQLMPTSGSSQTDDRGEYRMFGITPGKYYIGATYGNQRMYGASLVGAGDEIDSSYPTIYYPGVQEPDQTTPIQLRGGEERSGIDFRLVRERAFRIQGRITMPGGGPIPRDVGLNLMPRSGNWWAMRMRNHSPAKKKTGEFEFRGVRPGSYVIMAQTRRGESTLHARVPVDVGGSHMEGLVVPLAPAIKISGQVKLDTPTPGETSIEEIRLRLSPREWPMGGSGAAVKADGVFEFRELAPGSYTISAYRLPDNAYLKAATLGDRDALDEGLIIEQGFSGGSLQILVGLDAGAVEGAVLNDDGQRVPGATVVLVPEEAKRKREDLFKQVSTDQYGHYSISGLAPGEYDLFAFDKVEFGSYRDPMFLERFEDEGEKVEIEEKSRKVVELKLQEVEE